MIGNRSQGLRLFSHTVVQLFTLLLFGLLLYASANYLERIDLQQINVLLYCLGVFVAGILSYSYSDEATKQSDLNSFRWVSAIRRSNYQTVILALIIFAIVFTTKDKAISRLFIGSFIALNWFICVLLNRYVPEWIARYAFRGENTVKTIFLGSAKSARRLERWSSSQPLFGVEVLGLITYEMANDLKLKIPILGEFMDMELIMQAYKVDQVVLLETRNSDWWVDAVIEICEKAGCRILIYNPWEEYFDKELLPVHQGGHTFFTLQPEPLENPINRIAKRLLDIAISLPIVLFVLPWLCLLVKIIQQKQAPGPMLFKQTRSGQRGREFSIYKFRSMRCDESSSGREVEQAKKGDDRIFPFGAFLRKSSLDEFPQFLNVLMGHMSAIGPRPHMIEHDTEFSEQVNIYRTRHFIKPGITGLAQCKGFRGEVTDIELIKERVHYDLEYIRRWSFWLDIWILFKTASQIVKPPKTAY